MQPSTSQPLSTPSASIKTENTERERERDEMIHKKHIKLLAVRRHAEE
jgi:hypothetical protein